MKSFDLLLCSGEGKLSKRIIQAQKIMGYAEAEAQISHAAMIYTTISSVTGRVYVFESTTMNKWCNRSGVQLNFLDEWLDNYNGKVWQRHIEVERTFDTQCGIDKLYSLLGRPYESGIPGAFELLRCLLPDWIPTKRTWELHCTEAIAEVYQEIGWLEKWHKETPNTEWRVRPNKLPPAVWWHRIDKLMTVKVGQPKQIK